MTANRKVKNKNIKDPLAELEVFEKNIPPIETEKDPLDLVEQNNEEEIPTYDSKSGSFIKNNHNKNKSKDLQDVVIKPEKINKKDNNDSLVDDLLDDILDDDNSSKSNISDDNFDENFITKEDDEALSSEVDELIDNSLLKVDEKVDESMAKKSEEILEELKTDTKTEKPDNKKSMDTKESKTSSKDNDTKSTTHMIDDVKVDENGVPLLNQFDSEKIKKLHIFKNSKYNINRIISIVIGLILTCYGVYQALNDSVKISDNVLYGEHETIAIAFIAIGLLIILLSFYKEIMKHFGFNTEELVESEVDDEKIENNDE